MQEIAGHLFPFSYLMGRFSKLFSEQIDKITGIAKSRLIGDLGHAHIRTEQKLPGILQFAHIAVGAEGSGIIFVK